MLILGTLVETVAPVCIVTGYYDRIAAFLLAGFCLLADLFFHIHWDAPPPAGHFNWIIFIKNLAVAGGLLVIAGRGPGKISVDAWRARGGAA
jgi:putative oxidoreductase